MQKTGEEIALENAVIYICKPLIERINILENRIKALENISKS